MCRGVRLPSFSLPWRYFWEDVSPMNQRELGACAAGGTCLILFIFFGGRRGVTRHVESDPEEEPLD